MRQHNPRHFSHDSSVSHPITFTNEKGNKLQVQIVNDSTVRVLHNAPQLRLPNYTLADDRTPPNFTSEVDDEDKKLTITTSILRIVVNFKKDLHIAWYVQSHPDVLLREDLPNRAYPMDLATGAVWHYMKRLEGDMYYGLGERTGDLNLKGRRFRLERMDCMGYDAETSDPLYKFCPFYLTLSKHTKNAHGIFYNNLSRTTVDLGNENDALWGPYHYYHAEVGPLDYYILFGPSVQDVIEGFASLMGKPDHLPPRYSFGYLASSMGYAEAHNAQTLLECFPDLCRQHDIPCDGLHLSSGYTIDEVTKQRYVFTWNKKRFPNPIDLMIKLKNAGIHVFANIKPWLLENHPHYQGLKDLHGFIWNEEDNIPGEITQWSGGAGESASCAYIDFTSKNGFDWWKEKVKTKLLMYGLEGLWNDNNEFTMLDDTYTFANEVISTTNLHHPLPLYRTESAVVGTPLQTLLMAQASYEAMREYAPSKRPFVITRSATPFIHKFVAQTWSGDNFTSWKSVKFNIPMGISAGLSIFPGAYGHDVGGFAGPKPGPELFV
ncbi:glycosyl hydrolases family 31-domain-containing protein, partial [Jimgerdemannia flammicorona]